MILNFTPHPIRLYIDDRPDGLDDLEPGLRLVIEPEDTPARLTMVPVGVLAHFGLLKPTGISGKAQDTLITAPGPTPHAVD